MGELDEKKQALLAQLDPLEEADDLEGQLAIYNQLNDLVFIDAYIFYNKGCVLYDLERSDEAAEAIMLSINLDLDLGRLARAHESLELLAEISEEIPKNTDVLHCLAGLESERNNTEKARNYYQKIIEVNDNDAIAHLNLGYFYYENSEMQSLAVKHFNRYLELVETEAERSIVEDFLRQMND